jgi:ABC-type phosphate transport system substrate-binding protein
LVFTTYQLTPQENDMKNLKTLCAAVMLTLVLTLPAFAGEMTTWIADQPPPPPTSTADRQISTTTAGQMDTMGSEAVDPVTQAALSVLQGALALF